MASGDVVNSRAFWHLLLFTILCLKLATYTFVCYKPKALHRFRITKRIDLAYFEHFGLALNKAIWAILLVAAYIYHASDVQFKSSKDVSFVAILIHSAFIVLGQILNVCVFNDIGFEKFYYGAKLRCLFNVNWLILPQFLGSWLT